MINLKGKNVLTQWSSTQSVSFTKVCDLQVLRGPQLIAHSRRIWNLVISPQQLTARTASRLWRKPNHNPVLCIYWHNFKSSVYLQTKETQDKSPVAPKCPSQRSLMPKSSSGPLFHGSHYLRNGMSPGRSVWAGWKLSKDQNKDFLLISMEQTAFSELLWEITNSLTSHRARSQGLILLPFGRNTFTACTRKKSQ